MSPEPTAEQAAARAILRHFGRVESCEDCDLLIRDTLVAVRPILATEIETLAAKLRSGFPEGPGDDTESYIRGIETAARLVREGRATEQEDC